MLKTIYTDVSPDFLKASERETALVLSQFKYYVSAQDKKTKGLMHDDLLKISVHTSLRHWITATKALANAVIEANVSLSGLSVEEKLEFQTKFIANQYVELFRELFATSPAALTDWMLSETKTYSYELAQSLLEQNKSGYPEETSRIFYSFLEFHQNLKRKLRIQFGTGSQRELGIAA